MNLTVKLVSGKVPDWDAVSAALGQRGFLTQLRMIDGELVFPDEKPPADWQELRVGTAAGVVTLRRGPDQVVCVIWGNADAPLVQARNALAWAVAAAGAGQVLGPDGPLSADAFWLKAGLESRL